jgi:hypothetical protein
MKQIRITRSGTTVNFETVSVDTTETVFFLNLDPLAEHWPEIAANKLGPAPSAPSSQCFPKANYVCKIAGHGNERGIINIFPPLTAANTTLPAATRGQAIAQQPVVKGGMSTYQISGAVFRVVGPGGAVIQSGSGVGPGLQLFPTPNDSGVILQGTPTLSGTYKFTFVLDDVKGGNLQQVQYSMVVS